ncbi:MAG: thiol:disulfide interchange protein DsbG [Legionellales bacterium]|nr:thiol:disulfide interchange protein DsbG [Legionellales bacterium]|tara:strand:- start:16599 stop:17408 length:810 start_codon:yes stop_codon:yes gene_type:complete
MKTKSILATLFTLMFTLGMANSLYADTPANGKGKTLVEKILSNQGKVVDEFSSLGNLQGFVVKANNGQQAIVYADKDGQFAIVGALFDGNGENVSEKDNQARIMSPVAKEALKAAKDTAWVRDGDDDVKKVIYVVGDPNCSYCNKFYQEARSLVKNKDVQLRWIWVGFLKPSSSGMAQAILAAKDPAKEMAKNENNFKSGSEDGGIKPLKKPSKEVLEKFNKNMEFMNTYQFPGTPVLIYQDKDGKPQTVFGVPVGDNLKKLVDSVASE